MFTGLIEDTGRVASLERRGDAAVLRIETALPAAEIAIGDSVAVNGVCLTVSPQPGTVLSFDVSPETMTRSTMRSLRSGSRVNLERALRLGDRLGGHLVSGHIDCIGKLTRMETMSGSHVLTFSLPSGYCRYLVEKGSVAIDGISLTVNAVTTTEFSVTIIPHTFAHTTLADIRTGSEVNIETDMIGKYLERLAQPWSGGGLNLKTLAEHGFL